jgi:hypothetical protein
MDFLGLIIQLKFWLLGVVGVSLDGFEVLSVTVGVADDLSATFPLLCACERSFVGVTRGESRATARILLVVGVDDVRCDGAEFGLARALREEERADGEGGPPADVLDLRASTTDDLVTQTCTAGAAAGFRAALIPLYPLLPGLQLPACLSSQATSAARSSLGGG